MWALAHSPRYRTRVESGAGATDLITVTEQHVEAVRSAGADVHVAFAKTVLRKSAASPMTGAAAKFREELLRAGVTDDQIALDRVSLESLGWGIVGGAVAVAVLILLVTHDLVAAGAIALVPFVLRVVGLMEWPYRAKSQVRVRASEPAQARTVIDIGATVAQASGEGVAWRYEVVQAPPDWVAKCIGRANQRAEQIARGLGVDIVAVHRYDERWSLPDRDVEPVVPADARYADGMAAMAPAGSGAVFSSQGDAEVVVTISYRIGNYSSSRRVQ